MAQPDCHCNHRCECAISGNIKDLETHESLPFASVIIKNTTKGVNTNEEGNFTLSKICDCIVTLQISFTGYKSKEISVHADHPEFLNIYLAPDSKLLESVIVLGEQKSDQQVSQNQSRITAEKIEKKAGSSFGEVMAEANGVEMLQTGGNIAKPVIDGLNSNRILILNNGIRYEGQQWGAEHAPAIDPMMAQNIEVIRGAASVKYGSGALGGVALVLPPELPYAENKIHGKVNLTGNTNGNTILTTGLLEGGINKIENMAWRVQGTFKRGGDLHTPDYNLTNTGVAESNYSVALGKIGKNSKHEIFYSHFNTELGILKATGLIENTSDIKNAIENKIPAGTKDFSYKIDAPKQEVVHNLLKLKSTFSFGQDELDIQYGFQHNTRKEFDIRRGSLIELPSIDLSLSTHLLDVEYKNYDFHPHQISIGLNGSYQINKNIPGTQTIPFIPNYNMYNAGLFFVDKWVRDKWTLEFGLRGDLHNYDIAGRDFQNKIYNSSFKFLSLSGLMGGKFVLDQNNIFRINVSSGWRPPHVAELYSSGTHQSAAAIEYGYLISEEDNSIINTTGKNIKKENSIKGSLNYEHHADRLHINFSTFYQRIFNYYYLKAEGITQGVRGTFPYFRYRTTNALYTGFDVKANYEILKTLSIESSYNYLYAKNLNDNSYFLFTPPSSSDLGLTYHIEQLSHIDHIDVSGGCKYVFQQNHAPETISIDEILNDEDQLDNVSNFDILPPPEGQFLVHAEISFKKFVNDNLLEWSISANNILNSSYKSYTNRLKYYADEKGRSISIGVIYHF